MRHKQAVLTIPPLLLAAMIGLGQNCAKYKPVGGDANSTTDQPSPAPFTKGPIELWYWHHSYLSGTAPNEPAKSKALIDRAVAAGYTGLALWDSSVSFIDRPNWDRSKLTEVIRYARSKGLKVLPTAAHFGYSNDTLQNDPNLAEGQRVIGTQFRVADIGGGVRKLQVVNSLAPLVNGGFEGGKTDWFSTGDSRVDVDSTGPHTGTKAAVIGAGTGSNARLVQRFTTKPWRLYHIRFWTRTQGFSGGLNLRMLDFSQNNLMINRLEGDVKVNATQDWTVHDFTFNSNESTDLRIYLGNWGGSQGTVWFDDISMEETGFINVLRRPGAPVRLYDPSTNTNYVEETDYARVQDPVLTQKPGSYDYYHTPPAISVPSGSRLTLGQTVSADYYSAFPIYGFQMGACLTELGYKNLTLRNIRTIADAFGADNPIMLSYDEMRHGNSCDACKKQNLPAGQLLANQFQDLYNSIRTEKPQTQFYVWSDMFSPFHNAVGNYYSVEGNWAGSWEGLPGDVIIMNWNLGKLTDDLKWFAGMDPRRNVKHRQIIAGYYDTGDGAASARSEIQKAQGVPGVLGMMYTTWVDDYSQLEAYADAAKAAWANYQSSY